MSHPDRKMCRRCGAFLTVGDFDICESCESGQCGQCGGAGFIERTLTDNAGRRGCLVEECPDCNGQYR